MGLFDLFKKKEEVKENISLEDSYNKTMEEREARLESASENQENFQSIISDNDKKIKDILNSDDAKKVNNYVINFLEREMGIKKEKSEIQSANVLQEEKEENDKLLTELCEEHSKALEIEKKALSNFDNVQLSNEELERLIISTKETRANLDIQIIASSSSKLIDIIVKRVEVLENIISKAEAKKSSMSVDTETEIEEEPKIR